MPLIELLTSQLLWVRVAALLFTCVAFSVTVHGAWLDYGGAGDWCIFCWASSFARNLLVLLVPLEELVELFGLQARAPVSWTKFPITVACCACLLCLSASIIFPLFFLMYQNFPREVRDHRIAATVFSCLATVAYMGEVTCYYTAPVKKLNQLPKK